MTFREIPIVLAALAALAGPALATEFRPVTDRGQFVQIIEGRTLTRPLVRLQVNGSGTIEGTGATRPVSGQWTWQNGYFCRDLAWGDRDLGYNCQTVAVNGGKLRFTSDKGAGDSADFSLR